MKLKNILLYILIFFLPTQLGKHFFFPFSILNGVRIDYLSPTVFFTDILIGILVLLNLSSLKTQWNKKIYIVLFFILLNIALALSPWVAVYKVFKYVELIVLFFIVLKSELSAKMILISIALSTTLQLCIGIVQMIQEKSIQGIFYYIGERYFTISTPGIAKVVLQGKELLRVYGTFSHPNSLAGFYLLLYTFILFEKRFNKYLVLKYCIAGISSILIFLSFSKITIGIFILINAWYLFKNFTCKFCAVGRIISLVIIATIFVSAQGDGESVAKRVSLIQDSLKIIATHPLFGVGFGNYVIAQSTFPIEYSYYFLQPVHTIFLLFLAEVGIPLFSIVSFFIYQFFNLFKKKERQISFVLLAVICMTGLFDHYWLTLQQNMLLIPLVFGLLKNQKWQ